MIIWRIIIILLMSWASAGDALCVNANDYDSFWLWAGVKPQPILYRAKAVYVLQGQIDAAPNSPEQVKFIPQGLAVPGPHQAQIWIVFRVHTVKWTPKIYNQVLYYWHKWSVASGPMVGIQIDFDSKTGHLNDYAKFLRELKTRLPSDCHLSITGLLDWGNHHNAKQVNQLGDVVDEIVIQTYRGRQTVPQLNAYLNQFKQIKFPFKIGLVQNGEWSPPKDLVNNDWFRGYVVFLVN